MGASAGPGNRYNLYIRSISSQYDNIGIRLIFGPLRSGVYRIAMAYPRLTRSWFEGM